ncbi:MAG: MoaD/ThiS family protein [Chthoniobacteraceae bacterium]
MPLTLLAFAQARDQLGFAERVVECAPTDSPRVLIRRLAPDAALETMRVAVDQEYADWDAPVGDAREVAIIPPVSGG